MIRRPPRSTLDRSSAASDVYKRQAEYDALFIRENTHVNHHTYRFARKAQSEGLAVMDAPDAILKCNNKVYLAERMLAAEIPSPKTMIVHNENRDQIIKEFGLPVVLKSPDSTFSRGVVKAKTAEELEKELDTILAESDLAIAQAYMPSDYDWRIGVLDGIPLYACKYYMAKGHWQIYNWNSKSEDDITGNFDCMPIACLLYTSDAADERSSVDLGGRRIIKKKKENEREKEKKKELQSIEREYKHYVN